MNKKILFMLCDSPTKETGFGRVVRALVAANAFDDIINKLADERCVERARAWIAQPRFGWNNIAASWLALMGVEGRP